MSAGAPKVTPVIMSGGAGTRLWPLSSEASPKQFHALVSSRTMLQDTALRVRAGEDVAFNPPIVVCNRRHLEAVERQLGALGVEPSAIVLEPFGRSTAAVAAIAARIVSDLDPGAHVLLLPADHVMADDAVFREAVARGLAGAERIVTFGIAPTRPETGYGYIEQGEPLGDGLFSVARFVEKPSLAVAEAYLAEGGYAWNGGIFLFAPEVMLTELQAHRPDILDAASAALAAARREGRTIVLADEAFAAVPSESLDIAVMERTRLAAVVPCDAGWADVGSWSELWRLGRRDARGNVVQGAAAALDTSDSLIWAEEGVVGVIGLKDIVVVAANGAVLVAPKSRAQDVKALVEQLRAIPLPKDGGP